MTISSRILMRFANPFVRKDRLMNKWIGKIREITIISQTSTSLIFLIEKVLTVTRNVMSHCSYKSRML